MFEDLIAYIIYHYLQYVKIDNISRHACFEWLFPVLEKFRQKWPDVDIDIKPGLAFEALPALQKENVDLVINYQEEDLREAVEAKFGKRPVDIFYDQVGGAPYEQGIRLLSSEGRALIVGFASGNIPSQPLSYLLVKNISIMGVFMISFENDDKKYLQSRMELIFDLYTNQQIEPVFKTIKFDEIVEYLDMIGSRKTVGRIVAVR